MKQPSHAIVMTTVATEVQATRLANAVVDSRQAACAQFWPIRSVYHWKGKLAVGQEYLLFCKTRMDSAKSLQSLIRSIHAYELPEIVVVPVTDGLPSYLDWINSETTLAEQPQVGMAPPLTFRRQDTKRAPAKKRGKS